MTVGVPTEHGISVASVDRHRITNRDMEMVIMVRWQRAGKRGDITAGLLQSRQVVYRGGGYSPNFPWPGVVAVGNGVYVKTAVRRVVEFGVGSSRASLRPSFLPLKPICSWQSRRGSHCVNTPRLRSHLPCKIPDRHPKKARSKCRTRIRGPDSST